MHPIEIDNQPATVWRHQNVERQRVSWQIDDKIFFVRPSANVQSHPRKAGQDFRIIIESMRSQAGWELWTENECIELWPDQAVGLVGISAVDTKANCIITKANVAIPTEINRRPLAAEEFLIVQQERLIDAVSPRGNRSKRRGNKRAEKGRCGVCGLLHDKGFTQIKAKGGKMILLGGILPKIVRLVHRAHENHLPGLSTKNDELVDLCDGHYSPCKAFYDLKHRDDYKQLFDTRRLERRGDGEIAQKIARPARGVPGHRGIATR
jgi:hypothetical protein